MVKQKVDNKKVDGYFFMSIANGELDVNMAGDEDSLAAAFATLMLDKTKQGADARRVLAFAINLTRLVLESRQKKTITPKEKYTSKTAKKVAKTQPIKKVAVKKK